MGKTNIEWTEYTWNPVTGCTKVSAGCDNCYAETLAERFRGTPGHYFEHGFDVELRPEKLDQPLRWRKPRRIFVNSMSDLFHDSVPDEYIARVFAVMADAEKHTFQVLTKRHARMRALLSSKDFQERVLYHNCHIGAGWDGYETTTWRWPLPNVWLGVSAEDQQWADIRIPALLDTPAAVRFVSAEPLLGPIDFFVPNGLRLDGGPRRDSALTEPCPKCSGWGGAVCPDGPHHTKRRGGIDWVIVGGESGRKARPMHPGWVRGLRDQCQTAGVAFLFKQWGEWVSEDQSPKDILLPGVSRQHWGPDDPYLYKVGKHRAGRELDGRTWDEYPAVRS